MGNTYSSINLEATFASSVNLFVTSQPYTKYEAFGVVWEIILIVKKHSKQINEALAHFRELLKARRLLLIIELGDPGVEKDELNCVFCQSGEEKYPIEVIQRISDALAEEWILERESRLSDADLLALQEGIEGDS